MIDRQAILRSVAHICRLFTAALLVPAFVALAMEPWDDPVLGIRIPFNAIVFMASAGACMGFWVPALLLTDPAHDESGREREGYLAVAAGWLVVTGFAALPFLLSGVLTHPVDAYFEAMSGLTTTGASVIPNPEAVPASVLFWRAFLQWLGGIGIVVLLVAFLANLTQGGLSLMRAEAGAHTQARLRPKLADTARLLGRVYLIGTAAMILILFALMMRIGMAPVDALFDAVYHTFTTFSTGGFSSHAEGIAFYQDAAIEWAIAVFMLVGATQFTLLLPKPRHWLRVLWTDPQWRFMVGMTLAATAFVTVLLSVQDAAWVQNVRAAFFATVTTLTGTGHVADDFGAWPQPALLLILLLMLTGGNAGSTAGGIKSARIVVLAKAVKREVRRLLHPKAVLPIRMGGRPLDEEAVSKAVVFFFTYISIWVAGALVLILLEPFSVLDAAAASASGIGNVGVGLGATGPGGSGYAALSHGSKVTLSALMWIGRLEIFTALLLFVPESWRH